MKDKIKEIFSRRKLDPQFTIEPLVDESFKVVFFYEKGKSKIFQGNEAQILLRATHFVETKNCIASVIEEINEKSPCFKFKATREFYKLTGIGCQTWTKIMAGKKQPDLNQLYALAKVLEVEPKDLLP